MAVFHGWEGTVALAYGPAHTDEIERAVFEWHLQVQPENQQFLLARPFGSAYGSFPLKQTFSGAVTATLTASVYADDDSPVLTDVPSWYQSGTYSVVLYLRGSEYAGLGNGLRPYVSGTGVFAGCELKNHVRQCPCWTLTLSMIDMEITA